ncbi:MAG: universal stress protein, partial [Pseudomonas alloputida]
MINIKVIEPHCVTLGLNRWAFIEAATAVEAIMNTYSRLLLICHPDLHPSPALTRAQALSSAAGATLHLVALSQLPSRLATLDQVLRKNARKQDAEHRKAWLADQVKALGELGITAYAETLDDQDPLKDLIRLAQLHRIGMVIKDIQHETALSRALLTPLDWQLLRRCPI